MLYYVEDSDTRFMRIAPGKMNTGVLDAIVETVLLNKIDAFVTDVCLQRANFPSSCRESYCTLETSETYLPEDNNVIANVKTLAEQGIDANMYLLEKMHGHGVEAWIAVRMNDIHAGEDDDSPLHTDFWKQHPEYRISNTPYENGLDFSHAVVRKYVLDFIHEVIERYDIDGIMLDWMRFPTFFRHREAWMKRGLLTDIQRQTAEWIREKSRRAGKRIQVAARVPVTPEIAHGIGLDVEEWAKEGIVDRIFISCFVHAQNYDAPVEIWNRRLNMPVTVSLDGWHRPYISAPAIGMDGAALAGAACAALSRGSAGVMIYNMMELNCKDLTEAVPVEDMTATYCDCPDAERSCLKALDNLPEILKRPRKYYLAWQDMMLTVSEQDRALRLGEKPALDFLLPRHLEPEESFDFHFFTGKTGNSVVKTDFVIRQNRELSMETIINEDSVTVRVYNDCGQAVDVESAAIVLQPTA